MAEIISNKDGTISEIDFAEVFQDAVKNSKLIDFKDKSLMKKIMKAEPTDLIIIKFKINTSKLILSVDFYNEEYMLKNF